MMCGSVAVVEVYVSTSSSTLLIKNENFWTEARVDMLNSEGTNF